MWAEGAEFEVDLCERHIKERDDKLRRYVGAARKVRRMPDRSRSPAARKTARRERAEIQEFARANGLPVPAAHGRIPTETERRWRIAQSGH